MENLMKIEKKNKGITLIALIITIIVMLILVGVSLTIAMQTGLFDTAGKATQKWKAEQEKENNLKINIAGTEYDSVDDYVGALTVEIPWIYEENENGENAITGINFRDMEGTESSLIAYESYSYNLGIETLKVPSTINGKKVTSVDLIFYDRYVDRAELKGVKHLQFSEGIKSINTKYGGGSDLWSYSVMSDLETITFPTTLEVLGDSVFADYPSLSGHIDLSHTNLRSFESNAFGEEFHSNTIEKISLPPTVVELRSKLG